VELEQRVKALEDQVRMLKNDIQGTLADIRVVLPDKPAAPARWQGKAWLLALLNMLVAVTLFTNIYLYVPIAAPFALSPLLHTWLRALWIAVAFVWLLLQMYPLALLLEQENQQWQGLVWRNALGFLRAHPGLMLGLTLVVLVMALLNAVFPAMWFVVGLVILAAVAGVAVWRLVELYWNRAREY
jgi:hypothetical protein